MDIRVTINTTTPIVCENEDIISLYSYFRSTSKPNEPTYSAFASDGSIVIRDNNLDLFKRAQDGEFDKFNYPVTISLRNEETGVFEAISTHIINRRPTYNYADKTLSIQLSDKIDSMDNLVYEGYPYNLEAETADNILYDLLTKYWDSDEAFTCLNNDLGNSNVIIATFNISSANTLITLENLIGMTNIDWGDGVIDNNLTHTYTTIGTYTCRIYGVTQIGNDAFFECSPLINIIIPNCITSIGLGAFFKTNITSITIPASVRYIYPQAFSDCYQLTNAIILGYTTDGLTKFIPFAMFENCINLATVVIPKTIKGIAYYAFDGCTNLTTINYMGTLEEWDSIIILSDNDALTSATKNYSYNYIPSNSFAELFNAITIQYPYIPAQTTYRNAFSSVLSLAHCALICDKNGSPRLIYLDKIIDEIDDTEIAVLTADKTQEAFTTSVILDNKYDNAQVQATNVSQKTELTDVYTFIQEPVDTTNVDEYIVDNVAAYTLPLYFALRATTSSKYDNNTKIDFRYATWKDIRGSSYTDFYAVGYAEKEFDFSIPQYTENNFTDILSIRLPDEVVIYIEQRIYLRQITNISSSDIVSFKGNDLSINSGYTLAENQYIDTSGLPTATQYITLSQNHFLGKQGIKILDITGDPTGKDLDTKDIFLYYQEDREISPFEVTYNGSTYFINAKFPMMRDYQYAVAYGTATYNTSANNYYGVPSYLYIYRVQEIPIKIEIPINGVKRTINLENIKAVGEGTKDNVAEVNSYGKLLQYGLNISAPNVENEINHITNYYENGLHIANTTVLGGVKYTNPPIYVPEFITKDYIYNKNNNASCFQDYGDGSYIFFADNVNATKFTQTEEIRVNGITIPTFEDATDLLTPWATIIDSFYSPYYGVEMRKVLVSSLYRYYAPDYPYGLSGTDYVLQMQRVNLNTFPLEITFAIGFNQEVEKHINLSKNVFSCGDIVSVKNYDNESPLLYRNNEDMKYQITENKIAFNGGAVTQALTLKEIPNNNI